MPEACRPVSENKPLPVGGGAQAPDAALSFCDRLRLTDRFPGPLIDANGVNSLIASLARRIVAVCVENAPICGPPEGQPYPGIILQNDLRIATICIPS